MKYENLILIGTSHIAAESIKEVREVVERTDPQVIAIELDKNRLQGLLEKKTRRLTFADVRHIGVKAYLFTLIASYVQKRLGKVVGVSPGSEMLEAVRLAKKRKVQLALIDQDISITLKRFSKAFTWKEKFRFLADVLRGLIFRKNELKALGIENLDLSKVPSSEIVAKLIKQVKVRYPSVYRVLIAERNNVMARNLSVLMKEFPGTIVAVVGAGHEEEIIRLIKRYKDNKIEFVGKRAL